MKNKQNMSPQLVPCPRSIQRRMRFNLAVAARARVNQARADIAQAILDTTKAKSPAQMPASAVTKDSPKPILPAIQVVQPEIPKASPKIWCKLKAGFHKLAHHISTSLPARRLPRLVNH
jgi:hypothetical protein